MSTSRRMVAALSSALLLITLPGAAPSSADPGNHTHKVFAPKSTPYNRTHEVWLARYMRWLQEIPTGPKTPLRPAGTRNCEVHGHLVFMGPHGTTRGCTVPEGKATATLLALGYECSTAEGNGRTYKKLRACAVQGFQNSYGRKHISVQVFVDGKHLKHPRRWTFTSPGRLVDFPKNNIWGAPAGCTKSVTRGLFYIVKPLRPGDHRFGMRLRQTGSNDYSVVRYPFTVKR